MERGAKCEIGNITEVLENGKLKYVELIKKKSGILDWSKRECFLHGVSADDFYNRKDAVYFFVVDEHTLKIGQTERTISERLEDYNSKRNGKGTENRVMEYLMGCNGKIRMYIDYPEGEISYGSMKMKMDSKTAENMYIKTYFSKFGCLPILNKGFC